MGRVEVTLLPLGIVMEDADIAVQQRTVANPAPAPDPTHGAEPHSQEDNGIASPHSSLGEGVRLIARILQDLLGRVRLETRRLVVHFEAAQGHVLTANLESALLRSPAEETGTPGSFTPLAKRCTFAGLVVQLAEVGSRKVIASLGGHHGCHGNVTVDWPTDVAIDGPTIEVKVTVGGMHLRTATSAVRPLLEIAEALMPRQGGPPGEEGVQAPAALSRSLMLLPMETWTEALGLPDGDRLLEERLARLSDMDEAQTEVSGVVPLC